MQVIYVSQKDEGNSQKKLFDLFLRSDVLVLRDPETQREVHQLPLNSTTFSIGGNNNRLVFFYAPQMGSDAAYFELDSETQKFIQSNTLLKEKLTFVNDSKKYFNSGVVLTTLVLAILFYTFFQFRTSIFGSFAFMIPFELEQKVGDQLYNPLLSEKQKKTLENFELLLQKLKYEKSEWPYPFRFHISSDTIPNAYATLGGHIFINKGLIQLLDEAEDLLGVIAHEMIHVKRRHVVKSTIQVLGMYSVMSLLFGDISGIVAVMVDQGAPLLSLSYSRGLEEEADDLAVNLLLRNQIEPSGLARALKKINAESQKLIKQSPGADILEKLSKIEVLSSHPDIDQRIQKLENMTKEKMGNQKFAKIKFDYNRLQSKVHDSF